MPPRDAHDLSDLVFHHGPDRIVLSPRLGGQVMSWQRAGVGELIKQPHIIDGSAMRFLLSEERYPGASFTTPHLVLAREQDERGFRIHLRYFWNTANAMARALGWKHKLSVCFLDGLVHDKIIRFDAARSVLLVELSMTNVSDQTRPFTPWLHNAFQDWVWGDFAIIDGEPEQYVIHEIYWTSHRAPQPTAEHANPTMRIVQHSGDDRPVCSAVLGAKTTWVDGMASYVQPHFGPGVLEGALEIRGKTRLLKPGQRWRANAFLAISTEHDGWKRWASDAPEELTDVIEAVSDPASDTGQDAWNPKSLLPLLQHWALPAERERGLMVLAPLDKLPFTTPSRYAGANVFSDFRAKKKDGVAEANVWLYATRDLDSIAASLTGPAGWSLGKLPPKLRAGSLTKLVLRGPLDLVGKNDVEVKLTSTQGELATLAVFADAAVTRAFPFYLKQPPAYLAERWQREKDIYRGSDPAEFAAWQNFQRKRTLAWVRSNITTPAPLTPRVVEHQVGPHCIRQKVLIQTEPGMWMPMYLLRPLRSPQSYGHADGKWPVIIFGCGSGPGKQHMAPDEEAAVQHPSRFNEWPALYQLSHRLGCIVLNPDHRGQGEWAEANHGQQPQRTFAAGYNIIAQDIWDHLKVVDYAISMPGVDTSRIICMGGSGGGNATRVMTSLDPRVAGGIISSSALHLPEMPEHFFEKMPDETMPKLDPHQTYAINTAAMTCLIAPRPVWIMDGLSDRGVLPTLPHSEEVAKETFEKWRRETNAARDEIERCYQLAGAEKNYRGSWFEGDHLAGFTFNNIKEWTAEYFGLREATDA